MYSMNAESRSYSMSRYGLLYMNLTTYTYIYVKPLNIALHTTPDKEINKRNNLKKYFSYFSMCIFLWIPSISTLCGWMAISRIITCPIWPCSGIALSPRFRNMRATRWVLAQVLQNTMKELPASSFRIYTKYTSWKQTKPMTEFSLKI